jgi:hypothetical protein
LTQTNTQTNLHRQDESKKIADQKKREEEERKRKEEENKRMIEEKKRQDEETRRFVFLFFFCLCCFGLCLFVYLFIDGLLD